MGMTFGMGITEAIEIAKTLAELAKRGATVELQERIVELREALVEAKEELLNLREQNVEISDQLAKRDSMVYERGMYWKIDDKGGRTGPYCQKCFDVDGKTVHLTNMQTSEARYSFSCRSCGNVY